MSDYLTMQNRIAREAYFMQGAVASGKQNEIKEAIQSAISFYEPELFWFNEQQATSLAIADFEYYAVPVDFIQMYSLSLLQGERWETLEPVSLDEAEQRLQNRPPGRPTSYCTFNQQFRLSPMPNASFELRLSYIRRLDQLVGDQDTNAWVVEAEAMIRSKAKAILFLDVSHDSEQAAVQDTVSTMWFKKLQKRTGQYVSTDQIRLQLF
jgi:hypothetical protein